MLTIEQLKQNDELPVVIVNNQGIIVNVNRRFETVFGWTYEEIVGQLLTVILPIYFRDAHNLGFSRFTASGMSTILNHPLQLKAVTKDHQEILSEHFIIAEKIEGEWLFAATLKPLQ